MILQGSAAKHPWLAADWCLLSIGLPLGVWFAFVPQPGYWFAALVVFNFTGWWAAVFVFMFVLYPLACLGRKFANWMDCTCTTQGHNRRCPVHGLSAEQIVLLDEWRNETESGFNP
jgi:hypothetical protein